MKVLLLAPADSPLLPIIRDAGDDVAATMDPVGADALRRDGVEFLVSYGYRHILRANVLDPYEGRIVNLHISHLPWNRGADPNFWSFVDDTPKGVTIHYMDAGVDTGDIIVQKPVSFSADDTLRTSYDKLQREICELFRRHWEDIRSGRCARVPQKGAGSSHKVKDKEPYLSWLTAGFDTPVAALEDRGRRLRMRPQERTK